MRRPGLAVAVLLATSVVAASQPAAVSAADVPPDTSIIVSPPPLAGGVVGPTFKVWGVAGQGTAKLAGARCRIDAGAWVACGTNPGATFSGISGGSHLVTAAAYDVNGLQDPTPATRTINVDATGPTAGPIVINDGAAIAGRLTWHLGVSASDPSGITAAVLSATPPNAQGTIVGGHQQSLPAWTNSGYTVDYTLLGGSTAPGQKTIWLQWVDRFGNRSAVRSASILYDPTAPPSSAWRTTVGASPTPIGGPVFVRGRLTASDGTRINAGAAKVTIDGHPEWTFDGSGVTANRFGWTVSFTPTEAGTYHGTLAFLGGDGVAPASAPFDVTVGPGYDMRPPDTFLGGGPPPASPNAVNLTSDSDRAASYECAIDGGPWAACPKDWTTPVLPDGLHVFASRGVTLAGVRDPTPAVTVLSFPLGADPGYADISGEITRGPWVPVTVHAAVPNADMVRVSGSASLDQNGVLAIGIDTPLAAGQTDVSFGAWSLLDPAVGYTTDDGVKLVVAQWHLGDGSWTAPVGASVILDTTAPVVTMDVSPAAPFIDDDEVLLVAKADEDVSFSGSSLPGGPPWSLGVCCVNSTAVAVKLAPVPLGTVARRTVTVTASDRLGNQSEPLSATVTVDRSAPRGGVSLPVVSVGGTVSATAIPIQVAAGTSDTGIGVSSTTLQASIGNAVYGSTLTTASSTAQEVVTVPTGSSIQARVRGVDGLGHVGAWTYSRPVTPTLYADGDPIITYVGWSAAALTGSLDGVHRTTTQGATATISFRARGFALVAPTGLQGGKLEVVIDGVAAGSIDLAAASDHPRQVVLARSLSPLRPHVVQLKAIVPVGTWAALDGIVVLQ